MQALNKILTFAHLNVSDINKDEFIVSLWDNLKKDDMKTDEYTLYSAPGSRLIKVGDIELFYMATENIFVACLISRKRVYYWKLQNGEFCYYFNYDNFLYWPKYKTLANFVYNVYYNMDSTNLDMLINDAPWKFFKSHTVFSPDCILGEKGPSLLQTIGLCCSVYGDYDDENLTSNMLSILKPWECDSIHKVEILKHRIHIVNKTWDLIIAQILEDFNILKIEYLLCFMRDPYIDEGYKFIELALNFNNVTLYNWTCGKYNLDKERIKQWMPLFPYNDVSRRII